MHRALPVGNKVCAARNRKRYEEQRAQRLRDMKGLVDSAPPQVMSLRHLKTNWKKAELLGQRYDTIERDNRHLLNHMNSIGARREYGATKSHSMPLLRDPPGGPMRQRETDRINQENALMLKRLQNMQAEYRTREWEDSYRRSQDYVRIRCEYPPTLLPKVRTPSRSGLTRLPPGRELTGLAGPGAVAADPGADVTDQELLDFCPTLDDPTGFSDYAGGSWAGGSAAAGGSRGGSRWGSATAPAGGSRAGSAAVARTGSRASAAAGCGSRAASATAPGWSASDERLASIDDEELEGVAEREGEETPPSEGEAGEDFDEPPPR